MEKLGKYFIFKELLNMNDQNMNLKKCTQHNSLRRSQVFALFLFPLMKEIVCFDISFLHLQLQTYMYTHQYTIRSLKKIH